MECCTCEVAFPPGEIGGKELEDGVVELPERCGTGEKMVDQLSEVSTDPLPFLSQDLAEESRQRRSDRTGQEIMSQSASISMAVVSQRITKTDTEILRGVRLRDTLKGCGRLWRCNPMKLKPQARSALFKMSRPVPSLDIFLSHTWCSKGRAKILSLLLQSGCSTALLFWFFGVALALALCFADALPMPFWYSANMSHFKEMCPLGPWVMLFGFLGTLLGLLLSPYVSCFNRDMCFVDAACIHQTNKTLMQRGINGIGGFLLVSRELRILWSQPYLSRLWCVFEVATYKKMNPGGNIVMAPLFVDESVLLKYLGILLCTVTYWIIRCNSDSSIVLPGTMVCSLPILITIHFDRRNFMMKHQLFSQFQNFDLDAAECSCESDREFVYAAISHLYGSKEAFTQYVRGPLQRELLEPICQNVLPRCYTELLTTPFLSLFLDFTLALWKQGAPVEDLVIYAVSMFGLATCLHIPAVLTMMILLGDRFAEPWDGFWGCFLNYLQTFLVFLAILAHSVAGFVVCFTVGSRRQWWFLIGCFFLFLAIRILTVKLRDKLQGQRKRLQKARSFQSEP
ncbi:unnamed protein product [Cladocopium goreaui]|uniref:Ammonium transporter 3 n=1 Tax=Cladocopium goreaui TaxID=2562237 RepID=A0A9P1D928_9DINO|nr:unnamed protein product [Cladocopium goreaui]